MISTRHISSVILIAAAAAMISSGVIAQPGSAGGAIGNDAGTRPSPPSAEPENLSGREALLQYIAEFHQRRPGAKVQITSGADHHHSKFYYLWKVFGADGNLVVDGFDYGEIGPDGRISRIVGFLGSPPPRNRTERH